MVHQAHIVGVEQHAVGLMRGSRGPVVARADYRGGALHKLVKQSKTAAAEAHRGARRLAIVSGRDQIWMKPLGVVGGEQLLAFTSNRPESSAIDRNPTGSFLLHVDQLSMRRNNAAKPSELSEGRGRPGRAIR